MENAIRQLANEPCGICYRAVCVNPQQCEAAETAYAAYCESIANEVSSMSWNDAPYYGRP